MPPAALRPMTAADAPAILALNAAHLPMVSALDAGRLARFRDEWGRVDVLDAGGAFAGFVVTVESGTTYDSVNYAWFAQRFDRFLYLDRIVVHPDFRRRGLAGLAYDGVEARAAAYGRLTLEVNLIPRNDPSLAFHDARGYREIGQQGDSAYRTSMRVRDLDPAG
ncbi:acetyltransferase [Pilimelia anulata]|uniref:Acetyltransferase n=1 Tax=Pilimelia anulata TaxID=53371 RepID=A0A8J3FEQ0_9ACTN|nr:GNAT family N-acetyltransferase [Pilimelia anulata]GGK01406.1 acetyltransferase [Pilimelia anulata]